VARLRLFEQINDGLDKALILISAPAGYGKTTLVSSWLRETGVASAWLSLDESDNDPIRFLQYFLAALQNALPSLETDLQDVLLGLQPAPFSARLDLLINAIASQDEQFVLVLDDFHTLYAGPILEMLTDLLEHLPPQMHLVIITRTDPPVPLSRLRARNQLVDIRAQHLRFTADETAIFLSEAMGLELTAEEAAALEARTEGWIAGLQLAAIAMKNIAIQDTAAQSTAQQRAFISAFSGSESYIMDYLVEEVLKQQPEEVASFLLQTSILDRLCGPLCDAVLDDRRLTMLFGEPNYDHRPSASVRRPSSVVLESLAHANLFLIPLDSEGRWYRYHHLFADVLHRRLEYLFPEQLPELHQHASRWYECNDLIPEAIRHASLAGDWKHATQLVEQNGCQLLMCGEVATLLNWIEAVEDRARDHPWLAILLAWALTLTGHLERVEGILAVAEEQILPLEPSNEARVMSGCIAAARAQLANLHGEASQAVNFARLALETLPDQDPFSRSIRSVTISILGDASWLSGRLVEARHAYTEAMQVGQAAGSIPMVLISSSNLAEVVMAGGQLHQSARIFRETIRLATRPDGQTSPLVDHAYAGLSSVLYEWNRLDEAGQYIQQCMELCRRWGNYDLLASVSVKLAYLEQAWHNLEEAQAALRDAEKLMDEHPLSPRRSSDVRSALASYWLAQGKPERAIDHVRQYGLTAKPDEIRIWQEPEYFVLLHLLLSQGDYDSA
jgi:LuxR family maltose regulon positive regulatory protein